MELSPCRDSNPGLSASLRLTRVRVPAATDWIWRSGYTCPGYAVYCGPLPNGTFTVFDAAIDELGRYLGQGSTATM